jgi:hypothetical protein
MNGQDTRFNISRGYNIGRHFHARAPITIKDMHNQVQHTTSMSGDFLKMGVFLINLFVNLQF